MATYTKRYLLANWLSAICVFCVLVFVLPSLILWQDTRPNIDTARAFLILSIAYSGARLALLTLEGREKLLSLTFWVFAYVWMGLAPLIQVSTGVYPLPMLLSQETLAYASIIVVVGYIAYDVGSWLARIHYVDGKGIFLIPYSLYISKRKVYILSLAASVLSAVAITQLGGFGELFSYRAEFAADVAKTESLVWTTLLRSPAFVALTLVWCIWIYRRQFMQKGSRRVWHLIVLSWLIALNAIANNPISTPRFFVGMLVLTLAFTALGWNRRYSFGAWVVGLLSTLLLLFPYADVFRSEYESRVLLPVLSQLVTTDYDAFQQVGNTSALVSTTGITFGYQLLGALFFFVPRSMWPDKPLGSGQLVGEFFHFENTNLSSPLWAEAYVNFGLAGVVMALFLYGFATSLLQTAYIVSERKMSLIRVLVPVLAAYQLFFLRGDLQNGIAYLTPIVACLFLAGKVVRTDAVDARKMDLGARE